MKIIPADEIGIPEHIRDKKDSLGRKVGKRNPIYKKNYGGGFNRFAQIVNNQFIDSLTKMDDLHPLIVSGVIRKGE